MAYLSTIKNESIMLTNGILHSANNPTDQPLIVGKPAVLTDSNFWNCSCPNQFVHSKLESFCPHCGCCQHQQPDSQITEVTAQIVPPIGLPRTVSAYGIQLTYAGQGMYPYPCKSADKHPKAAIYFNYLKCAWSSEFTSCFALRDKQLDTY